MLSEDSQSKETLTDDEISTEKVNGMFATLIIVLPTEFTGGDAHLSHSGISTVINSSAESLSKTTVLSWYTDVMHEIVGGIC
jgi:hypothetical protein